MVKKIFLSVLFITFVFSSVGIDLFTTHGQRVFSADKDSFQFKKQPEIQQVKPKKPVKIKLKRSADGKYAWELTGDDVDEIVRADRRLKKLLKIEEVYK